MKKYLFLLGCMVSLWACQDVIDSVKSSKVPLTRSGTSLAQEMLYALEQQPSAYGAYQTILGAENIPLYEHTTFTSNSTFRSHYTVPLKNRRTEVIESAVVVKYEEEGLSIVHVDKGYIEKQADVDKFFSSVKFYEFQLKRLPVEEGLYQYAEELCERDTIVLVPENEDRAGGPPENIRVHISYTLECRNTTCPNKQSIFLIFAQNANTSIFPSHSVAIEEFDLFHVVLVVTPKDVGYSKILDDMIKVYIHRINTTLSLYDTYILDYHASHKYNAKPGGGSGGNSGGSIGGTTEGGNSGSGSGSSEPTPDIGALFLNNGLGEIGNVCFQSAIEDINNECVYEFIINDLAKRVQKFEYVKIDPTIEGNASANPQGLKFRDEMLITPDAVAHEFIHMYQIRFHHYTHIPEKARGMMEYERHLIEDIHLYVKYHGSIGAVEKNRFNFDHWCGFSEENTTHEKEYIAWLNKLTNNAQHLPKLLDAPTSTFDSDFHYWAKIYGTITDAYSIDKGYEYENARYHPTAMETLFSGLRDKCN